MEKTTLYLPEELQTAVRALARRTGRSQAALIREALEAYVRQQGRLPLRSLGMGENEQVRAQDTATWLERHFRPA